MSATYGEQVLRRAESRSRVRATRRRLILMIPTLGTAIWALLDLLAARRGHLASVDAGGFRRAMDPILPFGWTVAFVILPAIAALKPHPLPVGAVCAFLAGPIVTPMLFGAGGWHGWQIAFYAAITLLVVGGAIERGRRLPG